MTIHRAHRSDESKPVLLRSASTAAATADRPRIAALDVLRGFALCGIALVNIGPVTRFGSALAPRPTTMADASGWLALLVQQRFFPIFSLLFGVGFSLLLRSAASRVPRPRLVLARRLLVLLPFGVLHQLVHPGEALTVYAVVGLTVLLPSSWLPRVLVAVSGAALIALALAFGDGGLFLVPGMFLLGSALVRYGVIDLLERPGRVPLLLLLGFAAASVPAVRWQLTDVTNSGFTTSSAVSGLLLAGVYVSGLLVLLGTRAASTLRAVFAPLGQMALTNYVTATLAMLLAGRTLDLPHSRSWSVLLLTAAAILAVQRVLSGWWLARSRQGPLEWLWRQATWGRREALRR